MTRAISTSDGGGIAFEETGPPHGAPLVLLHSLGSDRSMWSPQLTTLGSNRRLILVDTRGHGASSATPGPYSLEMLGRDVIDVADQLGIDRFDVCGVSLGGQMALWLGVHRPERVRALIACNTAARIGDADLWNARIEAVRSEGMDSIREGVVARWFAPDFADREPLAARQAHAVFATTDPEGYIGCCAALADADLRSDIGAIGSPTLIVGGELDMATPPEDAEWLHDRIPGSELEVISGAAHLSNLDRPDAFDERIQRFLRSVETTV